MTNSWEKDNCAAIKAHYSVYSIPHAAALWCGIPKKLVPAIIKEAKQLSDAGLGRSIWTHSTIPCLEPRSRAIAAAIENGSLAHGREDGTTVSTDNHVAYDRRHVLGHNLKKWMEKTLPNEKPAFLFDDIERNTHSAISADAYRALKAERDTLQKRIDKATESYRVLRQDKESIEAERDSLKVMVDNFSEPGKRAETTYQNIIAALLECITGNVAGIEKHPSFESESKLIEFIDKHYQGYSGLSQSNLSRKFPEAKRALKSQ